MDPTGTSPWEMLTQFHVFVSRLHGKTVPLNTFQEMSELFFLNLICNFGNWSLNADEKERCKHVPCNPLLVIGCHCDFCLSEGFIF